MMESIVLFCRCELTHLYGSISKALSSSYDLLHIAYSDTEEAILRKQYEIKNVINFRNETFKIFENELIDDQLQNEIDQLIINTTNKRFCLNSSIQSDRTFEFIPYSDSLILSQVYYKFWENIFISKKIKFLFHEPVALFFTHIAAIICKKYGAEYLSQIQVIGDKSQNWLLVSGENGFPIELNINLQKKILTEKNRSRSEQFITNFRNDTSILFQELNVNVKNNKTHGTAHFIFEMTKILVRGIRNAHNPYKNRKTESFNHVELFSLKFKRSIGDKLREKWNVYYTLDFDDFEEDLDYYYYPIHLEPEAVVLYWGDGIYKNQVKLIENIAGQLPPGCFLFVKDHPHGGDYRKYIDYKRIKAIPNVKLLHPSLSGKRIIIHSRGVITISGTSGFEAIVLNKQVYTFGESFYSIYPKVHKIENIRDFRGVLYQNFNKCIEDDLDTLNFVHAYLQSSHEGFVSFFSNRAELMKIDYEANAEIVSAGLLSALDNLK